MNYNSYISLRPLGELLSVALQDVYDHLPSKLQSMLSEVSDTSKSEDALLNKLYVQHFNETISSRGFNIEATIVVLEDLVIEWDGLPLEIALSPEQDDSLEFDIRFQLNFADTNDIRFSLLLERITLSIRFESQYLKLVDNSGIPTGEPVSVKLPEVAIRLDQNFDVNIVPLGCTTSFSIPECMIGDSGVIIELSDIQPFVRNGTLNLGEISIRFPNDLPTVPDIVIKNASIGKHGFSGRVGSSWDLSFDQTQSTGPNHGLVGKAVGPLFNAFYLGIRQLSINFDKNVPVEFDIQGLIIIPALDNGPIEAVVSLGANGGLQVGMKGIGQEGLLKLTKEQLFELQVNSVEFRHDSEETSLVVGGDFQITNNSVKEYIPKIGLQGFSIYKPKDGDWGFRIEGGSVEINKSINLFGVARADIKEIGIGKRDDWNVFEFSGGLTLEGINASGWVYGLRVPYKISPDIEVGALSLDGIGLEMVVPNTLEFKGEAVYIEEGNTSYFQGGIALNVIPAKLGIAASIKVGRNPSCRFAFLSAEVMFPPPGVPLGQLPLYITSVSGLVGINMQPDADTVLDLVPLFQRPPKGLMDASKWRDACGSHAIGFGVGLSAANPTLINISALMVFTHPELQLLIEGKAFVLESPKPGKEPPLHSLIAMDIDEPSALIFVEADYEFVKGVIDAQGACEVYYGPAPGGSNKTISYFALGKVQPHFPTDQPIEAQVLQLFGARAFLYISPEVWDLGGEIALRRRRYGFSFASVHFEAFIKGRGTVYWGPNQFNGSLKLSGRVGFRVMGIGFDLSVGATVIGKTPDWLVDASLWFGVKFKILWKKFKFGGTIRLHWEKRITPPIPEWLKEIQVKSLIEDTSAVPFITHDDIVFPAKSIVPEVEPDTAPALSFNFSIKDSTETPFGQDVNLVPNHKSGDHEFRGELKIVKLSRLKIDDWLATPPKNEWEDFQPGFGDGGFNRWSNLENSDPILYGAWQKTQDPQGVSGATELHLFARTPFDYNRPSVMLSDVATAMWDQELLLANGNSAISSSVTAQTALQNAARSIITVDNSDSENDQELASGSLIGVPYYSSTLKAPEKFSNSDKALPYLPIQQTFIEQPQYPFSGVEKFDNKGNPVPSDDILKKECCNFLGTEPGYKSPSDIVVLSGTAVVTSDDKSGNMLFGGYTEAYSTNGGIKQLGTCEIVREDLFAYPFQYLEWHTDSGFDPESESLVSIKKIRKGCLKFLFKPFINKITIHYETIRKGVTLPSYIEILEEQECSEDKRLRFLSADPLPKGALKVEGVYRKEYSAKNFWQNGDPVKPSPSINNNTYGQLVISTGSGNGFNEILFNITETIRIYSICFQIDPTEDIQDSFNQLEDFIYTLWPGKDDNGNGDSWEPGPANLYDVKFKTPEGGVEPGYLYKLHVQTSQERLKRQPSTPIVRDYYALFSVPRPPSNLAPYIVTSFPRADKFPHYRSCEIYLRMFKNYVHKLMGDQNDRVTIEIRREGELIESLPFQDGKHSDLQHFLANTSEDRKGWGWGKAGDEHILTPEEEVWMESYNANTSPDRTITNKMALPDDMIWAYPVNPVLFRSEFKNSDLNEDAIKGFLASQDESGALTAGRWKINNAILEHVHSTASSDETELPESFLITETQFTENYMFSIWLRAKASQPNEKRGHMAIVLAAVRNESHHLSSYILINFDLGQSKISLIQKNQTGDPAQVIKVEKRFSLPLDRWARISIRVARVTGKVAITANYSGEQIFSVLTDFNELNGHAGLMVHPILNCRFDNLEVLSINRLKKLPGPDAKHQLVIKYQGLDKDYNIYKADFRASKFIDLFDHINAWDRQIYRSQKEVSASDAALNGAIDNWVEVNEDLYEALADLDFFERQHAIKLATLAEVDECRKNLREARFDLDERFGELVDLLAFELNPRPQLFEFILAKNGKGLLIQSSEPIDWMRIGCGPVTKGKESSNGAVTSGQPITTRFIYSSDLTRAILLLQPDERVIQIFEPGGTYVWTIKEYVTLPPQLKYLEGWVSHRRKEYDLTLEIPN